MVGSPCASCGTNYCHDHFSTTRFCIFIVLLTIIYACICTLWVLHCVVQHTGGIDRYYSSSLWSKYFACVWLWFVRIWMYTRVPSGWKLWPRARNARLNTFCSALLVGCYLLYREVIFLVYSHVGVCECTQVVNGPVLGVFTLCRVLWWFIVLCGIL